MGKVCAVLNCRTNSSQVGPETHFHRFPLSRKELCDKWIAAIQREDWQPTNYSRVCSAHFLEDDYDQFYADGRARLKLDTVPSVFDYPNHLQQATHSKESVKSNDSTLRKEARGPRKLEDLKFSDGKFLGNFDPGKSGRETRKLNRKASAQNKGYVHVYDDKGVHLESGVDLCDCLEMKCPGCFFPCPSCTSSKCGVECRVNRKYTISHYDIEGTTITIKNPLL